MPPIVSSLPGYKGPVLLLQGGRDANVDPAGAKRIDDARAAANPPDHTLIAYPNLGHLLGQTAAVDAVNSRPTDSKPLGAAAAWLDQRFKK